MCLDARVCAWAWVCACAGVSERSVAAVMRQSYERRSLGYASTLNPSYAAYASHEPYASYAPYDAYASHPTDVHAALPTPRVPHSAAPCEVPMPVSAHRHPTHPTHPTHSTRQSTHPPTRAWTPLEAHHHLTRTDRARERARDRARTPTTPPAWLLAPSMRMLLAVFAASFGVGFAVGVTHFVLLATATAARWATVPRRGRGRDGNGCGRRVGRGERGEWRRGRRRGGGGWRGVRRPRGRRAAWTTRATAGTGADDACASRPVEL